MPALPSSGSPSALGRVEGVLCSAGGGRCGPRPAACSLGCMGMRDEAEVRALYRGLLDAWNGQDADGFGPPFAVDGEQVGCDGSQVVGAAAIAEAMGQLFADHRTARYVALVRSVRFADPDVGMAPP